MSTPWRAWSGGIVQETNRFSPIPTAYEDFEDWGGDHPSWPGWAEFIDEARQRGVQVHAGRLVGAHPAGPVSAATWQRLRGELLASLAQAGPVDLVWLVLHGSQLAEGCDDCEGDLITAVRAQVGPGCRIGVLLDLHASISPAMLTQADLVMACHRYPHTDLGERARLGARRLIESLGRPLRWTTAAVRVPAFGAFPTTEPPFDALVQRLQACEALPGVVAASTTHGFLGADSPWLGGACFVTTEGDAGEARRLAQELAEHFYALIRATPRALPSVDAALAEAAATEPVPGRPVVLADAADNAGGGAASDGTQAPAKARAWRCASVARPARCRGIRWMPRWWWRPCAPTCGRRCSWPSPTPPSAAARCCASTARPGRCTWSSPTSATRCSRRMSSPATGWTWRAAGWWW
jgi:microcystin degradation protein MlrC